MKLCLIMGPPASGKTTVTSSEEYKDYERLNRDESCKTSLQLLELVVARMKVGSNNILVDGLFPTIESRAGFIREALAHGYEPNCVWMRTTYEQSQINALHRMWQKYGRVFLDNEEVKIAKGDPNIFSIGAIFKHKRTLEKPTKDEGFTKIYQVKNQNHLFKPEDGYVNKAAFLDFDGTLRETVDNGYKYPIKREEVTPLPNTDLLNGWREKGYKLFGVSNQSGVGKGIITYEQAEDLFVCTQEKIGIMLDEVQFCHHPSPPKCFCYCRKPQSGMAVYYIEKYKLNPAECIMVGDYTSDKTWAKRLGMTYYDEKEFFKR